MSCAPRACRKTPALSTIVGRYKDEDLNRSSTTAAWPASEANVPMVQVLGHVFNHQTHHRGQVHGLLSDTRVPPPSLDMILMSWA